MLRGGAADPETPPLVFHGRPGMLRLLRPSPTSKATFDVRGDRGPRTGRCMLRLLRPSPTSKATFDVRGDRGPRTGRCMLRLPVAGDGNPPPYCGFRVFTVCCRVRRGTDTVAGDGNPPPYCGFRVFTVCCRVRRGTDTVAGDVLTAGGRWCLPTIRARSRPLAGRGVDAMVLTAGGRWCLPTIRARSRPLAGRGVDAMVLTAGVTATASVRKVKILTFLAHP